MTYHVPISRLPLLQDPPFVLALVVLGMALGYRMLRLLGAPLHVVTRLERGVLSAAVGLGMLQYLAFGLGSVGQLTPVAVRIGLVGLALIFARDIGRVLRACGRAWSERCAPERWIALGLALLAIPLAAALLSALCPCTDPDGLGYHLRAPKEWLQLGSMGYLPTLTHTNSPMGVEMLFTLALAVWSDTAAKLIHFALGILALAGVYALGRRVRGEAVGFAAMALTALALPGANSVLTLFTLAYIDLGVMLEVVCAMLAWLVWRQTKARGWLLCAALCAGLGASFKLTGLLLVAGMGIVIFIELKRDRDRDAAPLSAILIWSVIALLPVLPWLARAWALTGNPVYPLLAHLFPTRDWSAQQADAFSAYMRYYNWGRNHTNWGLSMRRAIVVGSAVLTALIGGAMARFASNGRIRSLLLLTTLLTALNLFAAGLYLRFFVPLMPLYFVLLFACLPSRLMATRGFKGAVLALMTLNSLLFIRSLQPGVKEAFQVATGRLRRAEYLQHALGLMPLWNYANQNLLPTARIAVVGTGDVYYCQPYCYIVKAYYQDRIRLDSQEHLLSDLQRDHIEYLVVPMIQEDPPYGPDDLVARNEGPLTHRLAQEHGTLLLSAGGQGLYRLENRAAPE